jgi:hypothetical protein
MRRWLAALVIVLSLLLTGCENNNGYYAVVYPYTVTVEEQEFTFLGVRPVSGYTVADANGHEYTYRRFTSDPYRVIEIHYGNNIKYVWKQHMEHEEICFGDYEKASSGDYSGSSDLTGYTPGEILVQAIQMPAPEMEYIPPQEIPKEKKDFPWEGLLFVLAGLLQLLIPDFAWEMWAQFTQRYWVKDPTPTEFALRWIRIEAVLFICGGTLQLIAYFFL